VRGCRSGDSGCMVVLLLCPGRGGCGACSRGRGRRPLRQWPVARPMAWAVLSIVHWWWWSCASGRKSRPTLSVPAAAAPVGVVFPLGALSRSPDTPRLSLRGENSNPACRIG
jgi:hypothetical protein